MIRPILLRRASLKVLQVLDRCIVEPIARDMNAADMAMYMCIIAIVGAGVVQGGHWFAPLAIAGWVIIAAVPLVPMLAFALERLIKIVHRPRAFADSQISAVLYWKVCDLLDERGITDVQQYFRDHPAHSDALLNLIPALYPVHLEDWNEIVALVFLTDDDPAATANAIAALVEERGDMPAADYKALLEIGNDTAAPLIEGAL